MNFWKSLFGFGTTDATSLGKTNVADLRDVLGYDEEWVTPEEWFIDTDGKRVRRKRKKSHEQEEEGEGFDYGADDVSDVVAPLMDAMTDIGTDGDGREVVPDGGVNGDNPGFVDPDLPSPSESVSYEAPSYEAPSYDSSSNYDSGSSYSSYDSGSSCDSGGCGGGCD